MRGRGADSVVERDPLHPRVACAQQLVRAILDPARHVGIGGAAVGRIVLEASILRRVVRRRDDDAVRQVFLAAAVV